MFFNDNPQLVGCCAQNQSMPILDDVPYMVNIGGSAAETARIKPYLQALGVQAIVVNGPQSTDEYKDIHEPARFDSILPILHREMGDTIYAIPQRSSSLAHIVRAGDVVPAAESPNADSVVRYAEALQDPSLPAANLTWLRGDTARISTTLTPGNLVSVQVAWFRGWKAYVDGKQIPITRDGLGFQLLHPDRSGPCEIILRWTGRPDRIPSVILSAGAWICLALAISRMRLRRAMGGLQIPSNRSPGTPR